MSFSCECVCECVNHGQGLDRSDLEARRRGVCVGGWQTVYWSLKTLQKDENKKADESRLDMSVNHYDRVCVIGTFLKIFDHKKS